MSIHAAITHRTSYRYDRPVTLGPQTIRLRPAPYARTPIVSYTLNISPQPHFINWQQDPQGNFQARVVFPERVTSFEVVVDLIADMATINPFDFFLEPEAETYPFKYDEVLKEELAPFRLLNTPGPQLKALIEAVPRAVGHRKVPMVDMLVMLNRLIADRIAYIVRLEPGVFTPEETLQKGLGSCRDSAWLLVNLLRHLGFAARFVSGYLIQLVADLKPTDGGAAGPTEDFTDLHAWAEVYLPGAGWIGLDATSGLMAGEGHIPLAATPSPSSAAPISGLVENCETTFGFEMKVVRVAETPRVTKPYSPAQWQEILAQGQAVDQALARGDVRLTMGGEPTFVCATDMEAAEWNTDAAGPTKRSYAGKLIRKLGALWAPGAALQYGMGKHYPGEQLPRWALHAHWRPDGEPVWRDPALLAADEDSGDADATVAAQFATALAERLQVDPALVYAAHEDVHYYLWREHRLPANVLAEDAKLRDPLERARLTKAFGQGVAAAVGSVLPLRRVEEDGVRRWQSGKWFFRDSVHAAGAGRFAGRPAPAAGEPALGRSRAHRAGAEPDPLAASAVAAARASWRRAAAAPADRPAGRAGRTGRRARLVRTALTVRGARRHAPRVPPAALLSGGLARAGRRDRGDGGGAGPQGVSGRLPAAGRRAPAELLRHARPRRHRGQRPSRHQLGRDGRAHRAAVRGGAGQRPGHGEVHAGRPPCRHRRRQPRGDGRREAGGQPVPAPAGPAEVAAGLLAQPPVAVLPVQRPVHRPLQPASAHRRGPAGLPSTSWRSPSARYRASTETPPWMVDRLFRNILTDMTGNTHRTEFCIDKMYDPGSASGRRGLVEFRAFEMPPHAEMSAAQMLLMRSAIAAFWQKPYERRMVRWGTRLHDEFLLPHYAEADFRDALEELGSLGFPLSPEWFAPHMEFRFPQIGEVTMRDMHLEMRHALEPWHVLGEEQVAGGTARYVDSSAERVQANVPAGSGSATCWPATAPRCRCANRNRGRVRRGHPLQGLAAVLARCIPPSRRRCRWCSTCMTRWTGRSLGGVTHHVAHPGGRSYETFPVNANAAEARRRSRFFVFGHSAGEAPPPRPVPGPEYPRTLDLRRFA